MIISDAFKMGMIINIFWVLVALYLNHKWYMWCTKMNDEWAETCEQMCSEIEEYYTKGDEKNEQSS